jgi:5'(3')-deoxyribonucleotidase
MKKVLLTDVDGVLVDWIGSFGKFAEKKGFNLKMPTPKTWEMTEWFGETPEKIDELIKEFNGSESFASIPAFEDAQKIIPILADHYDIVAITCCSDDQKVVERRTKNLEVFGVKFKDIHCLPQTASKTDLLKSYSPTIWVEDRIEGAEAGHRLGHKSFLRKSTYNEMCSNKEIKIVSTWEEILKFGL